MFLYSRRVYGSSVKFFKHPAGGTFHFNVQLKPKHNWTMAVWLWLHTSSLGMTLHIQTWRKAQTFGYCLLNFSYYCENFLIMEDYSPSFSENCLHIVEIFYQALNISRIFRPQMMISMILFGILKKKIAELWFWTKHVRGKIGTFTMSVHICIFA